MEWPEVASNAFAGLPEIHRVAGFYVLLAIGGVAVLTVVRRWLAGAAASAAAAVPAAGQGPSLKQMMTAAVNAAIDKKFNGSPTRIERMVEALSVKVDRLDEKVDGQGERLARVEERQIARSQWDGHERRGR